MEKIKKKTQEDSTQGWGVGVNAQLVEITGR